MKKVLHTIALMIGNARLCRIQKLVFVSLFGTICIGFGLLFFVPEAGAKEIRLTAFVNRNEITLEDSLQLSVTIHGVQNASAPTLPNFPGFKLHSSGTSSSTKIINGKMTTSKIFHYRLLPQKIGSFTIAPITIKISGKTYASKAITVQVHEPSKDLTGAEAPAYVESIVSNQNPYLHEQIVYTFKLFRRVNARNFKLDMPYDPSFFQKEKLGDTRKYSEIINGVEFRIHELSIALFPTRVGKVMLPGITLELDILRQSNRSRNNDPFARFFDDPFFNTRRNTVHKVLRTQPIEITTRSMPELNKPENYSHLVGSFALLSTLGKTDLEVGDSTTLTLTISGTGNVKDAVLSPEFPPDLFKVYPDQPESRQDVSRNSIIGNKTFKFALVPLKAGDIEIPTVSISYFDPEKGEYVEMKSERHLLNVQPSSTEDSLNSVQSPSPQKSHVPNKIKVLGKDILPIHTHLEDFRQVQSASWNIPGVLFLILTPPLLFLFISQVVRAKRRLKNDPAYYRNQMAWKMAQDKLDALSRTPMDSKQQVKQLSKIMREYIGNKLNLPGGAITSNEVEEKMRQKHFDQNQAQATREILEKCESLQFAPDADDNFNGLLSETRAHLQKLEHLK